MDVSIIFNKELMKNDTSINGRKCIDDEICNRYVDAAFIQNNLEMENKKPNYKRKGLIAQCLLTAVVAIAAAGGGMPIGYSAILLPQLKSVNGSLQTDEEMGSWIASIHSGATPVGSLLSGTLMELLGRKITLQISCIPLVFGWIFIALCENHALLLTGRVLAGVAVGLTFAAAQVYIAEISDPAKRGVFSSIPFTSFAFGILLVYMLGSIAHWRMVAGLSIILPAIAAVLYFFLPDSPASLIKRGDIEGARKACIWLRGGDVNLATQEIEELINRKAENEMLQQDKRYLSSWTSFCTPHVLKPFIIINIFILIQLFSGVYLIVFYAVDIITHMGGGDHVNEFFIAVLTAGVRFIFTVIASILLAFVGQRTIGLSSSVGTGVSALCVAMCLYFTYLKNYYLITACLLIYVAANTVGLTPLPGIMIGEMFPAKIRGFAGGLTYTLYNLQTFGTTKVFPLLKNWFGIPGLFLLFGITSLLGSLFIYGVVPETKGKSLNEIEDYFLQDNIMWVTRNKKNEEVTSKSNTKL